MPILSLALTLLAPDPRIESLLAYDSPPRIEFATCTPETDTFLNRTYRLIAAPAELLDRPRIVFDGGQGHQLPVTFTAPAAVIGAFHYNQTGAWDWPDRQPASAHGWTLYRTAGYRGDSNAVVKGQVHFADVYSKVFEAGDRLRDLPPWWVCLAIVPAEELPALRAADKQAPLAVSLDDGTPMPVLVAHRGLLAIAPENTLPAFRAALAVGLGIELDVAATADGEIVVMHDHTVDRTTDGQGKVADLTLAQLRALDAGVRFHPDFAGTGVPLLREVLDLARTESLRPTPLAVNLKQRDPAFIDQLTRIIVEAGVAERCFLFDCPLAEADAIQAAARGVAVTASAKDEAGFRAALAHPAVDSVWVYFIPTKALMDEARALGKQVHVTPFMDAQGAPAWRAIRAAGVTTFCTDRAPEVRRLWAPRR